MDPVLGSVIVALIASVGAIGTAVVTGRNSTERVIREARIDRLERLVTKLGGDPDEV